jgi:hypothetical protein
MRVIAVLLAVLTALPQTLVAGSAQAPVPQPAVRQGSSTPAGPQPTAEAVEPREPGYLGMSLVRIRRDLHERPPSPAPGSGLRYDFHVDVFGEKPPIDFFENFYLGPGGAVRYGGMTHAEFVDLVTPQEFKSPAAGLIGLALLAIQGVAKLTIDSEARKRRQKEKEEAEAAEQYRKEHPAKQTAGHRPKP